MSALTVFLVVVAVLVVLVVTAAALVAFWLGRHAVRAGRVVGRQARAGWSTARAAVPSQAQEIRAERARLDRELASTSNAWQSGRRLLDRASRKRLAEGHAALARIARQLAYELSIVASDRDPAARAAALPSLRLRVDAFVVAGSHFRQGILLASGAYGDGAARVADTAMAVTLIRLDDDAVSLDKESVVS